MMYTKYAQFLFVSQGCGGTGSPPYIAGGKVKWSSCFGTQAILQKKHTITIWPQRCIYPRRYIVNRNEYVC